MTNGDRIRQMSDEELAANLQEVVRYCSEEYNGNCLRCTKSYCESLLFTEWLKEEITNE